MTRRREQERLRQRIVFGLSQQVGSDEFRPRRIICDHHHLGWTCGQIERSAVGVFGDHLLGSSDPCRSRPDDLVDFGDGLRPVSERCDRLRPADGVDLLDAAQTGRGEDRRMHSTAAGGTAQHAARDARDRCGDR